MAIKACKIDKRREYMVIKFYMKLGKVMPNCQWNYVSWKEYIDWLQWIASVDTNLSQGEDINFCAHKNM